MLKKITTPSNNIFCGVEFILRGAKKRRAMAVSNAVAINTESGIQVKLQAVKQGGELVFGESETKNTKETVRGN